MPLRQALLIQDISYFRAVVDPIVQFAMAEEHYVRPNRYATFDFALRWIICEQIFKCYGLYDNTHRAKEWAYQCIHSRTRKLFHESYPGWDFDSFFSRLIKVPRLYGEDSEISTSVQRTSLYIHYKTWETQSLPLNYDHARSTKR